MRIWRFIKIFIFSIVLVPNTLYGLTKTKWQMINNNQIISVNWVYSCWRLKFLFSTLYHSVYIVNGSRNANINETQIEKPKKRWFDYVHCVSDDCINIFHFNLNCLNCYKYNNVNISKWRTMISYKRQNKIPTSKYVY